MALSPVTPAQPETLPAEPSDGDGAAGDTPAEPSDGAAGDTPQSAVTAQPETLPAEPSDGDGAAGGTPAEPSDARSLIAHTHTRAVIDRISHTRGH